ncbi:hypothetical protein MCOR25_002936 [Pyricularia grisea]|nr:hypothetical protein MCOR25_002936 [Pyricularia grisea]
MAFQGNITLVYIDRTDVFGPSEKRPLVIPPDKPWRRRPAAADELQLRRLEGALEVKQPPEHILVALGRLYTSSEAGIPSKGQGRQRDDRDARVYKLTVPGADPCCRQDAEPQEVFVEMVRHIESGRDVNLQLQRPWHLDSACMAGDYIDDMDIEDRHHQMLPQLPGNKDPTDGTSNLMLNEPLPAQEEAALEGSDAESEAGGSRRKSSFSSIAESDRTTLTELSDDGCSTSNGDAHKQSKDEK